MGHSPGAGIAMASVANLRDIGGWPTRDGEVVRPGVLYRAAGLSRATDDDVAALAGLGIGTVFDLRTTGERAAQPDRLPPTAALVVADVLGEHLDSVPAHMFGLLADPVRATEELSGGRAEALLMQAYEQIVTLPSAHAAFACLYRHLALAGPPVLVHCTTGKDRTGWAAAALLLHLGVAEEDVMAEYLLTNEQLLPALSPLFTAFAEAGGDPAVLGPVLGVRPEYLGRALDLVVEGHGSLEGYFRDALGLEDQVLADLRSRLLVGGSR